MYYVKVAPNSKLGLTGKGIRETSVDDYSTAGVVGTEMV